jgi:hypothetical protein
MIGVTNATVTMGANLAAAFNEAFAKPQGKANVFAAGHPSERFPSWFKPSRSKIARHVSLGPGAGPPMKRRRLERDRNELEH